MEYMEKGCHALIRFTPPTERGGQTIQGYQSLLALSARWRSRSLSLPRCLLKHAAGKKKAVVFDPGLTPALIMPTSMAVRVSK